MKSKHTHKNQGLASGIFGMFSRLGGENIIVFREDCEAGYDRRTGKRIVSNKIKFQTCAIVETKFDRSIIQDSGGERARGKLSIQTTPDFPLYTADQRDNAGADIIYVRGSFWKVMETRDERYYWEAEVQLMPQDECKSQGISVNGTSC